MSILPPCKYLIFFIMTAERYRPLHLGSTTAMMMVIISMMIVMVLDIASAETLEYHKVRRMAGVGWLQ